MENTWMQHVSRYDAPYHPTMFTDPFAYRARLSDANLDFDEDRSRVNDNYSVLSGLITQEEANRRREARQTPRERERKKEEDRYLEIHVDAEWNTSDEDEDMPLTPPHSPNHEPSGLDLSVKAWNKECLLIHLRGRFEFRDFGFEDYETWKQYQIKHSQPSSATSNTVLSKTSQFVQPPLLLPPPHPSTLQSRTPQKLHASRNHLKQ
ncbi:MAG: hypothetical protein Q9165_008050 [Trypethelium subeluteriae]